MSDYFSIAPLFSTIMIIFELSKESSFFIIKTKEHLNRYSFTFSHYNTKLFFQSNYILPQIYFYQILE